MKFSKQEYWSRLPFPTPGDLPNPRSNTCLLHWQADCLPLSHFSNQLDPCVGKIPWRGEWLPTPVFWPGEFHWLYSAWGHKESDMIEWLSKSWQPWCHPPWLILSNGRWRQKQTKQTELICSTKVIEVLTSASLFSVTVALFENGAFAYDQVKTKWH